MFDGTYWFSRINLLKFRIRFQVSKIKIQNQILWKGRPYQIVDPVNANTRGNRDICPLNRTTTPRPGPHAPAAVMTRTVRAGQRGEGHFLDDRLVEEGERAGAARVTF